MKGQATEMVLDQSNFESVKRPKIHVPHEAK